MPTPTRARSRSSTTETSADNRQAANTEFPPWDGSHTRQTTWFNRMLKLALTSYANRALIEYNVVVMPKSGHIAVFSTEHAIAHAHGTDKGTARAPNTRKRADLLTSPVQQAGTPAPPLIGGSAGHPAPTPSQPTVPVPPTVTVTV